MARIGKDSKMMTDFVMAVLVCSVTASAIQAPAPAPGPSASFLDIGPAAAIPVPFSGQFSLDCGSGLIGGYSQMLTNNTDIQPLAAVVQRAWVNQTGNRPTNCEELSGNSQQPSVRAACSQVVAGMNYALVVEATLTCRNGNGLAAVDRVSIAAKVYQPPAAVDPEVTFVKQFDLEETPA